MTHRLLTLGHGYTADHLARRLIGEGWEVWGTTRSPERAEALAARGVRPVMWPEGDVVSATMQATHILASASPEDGRDPFLDRLAPVFAAAAPRWVGYLSTTGVYGDHDGDWVDETTPLNPGTTRGAERVLAERQWLTTARETGLPLHIFRLAGIYGPGRGPFQKVRDRNARKIIKPGQVFSRIHVDDIATVLQASMRRPNRGRIYNVCDDEAAPPQEVIGAAADLLGVPQPPEVPFAIADMSDMARSFYAESKRVRNDRMKAELGVELAYPTYREGLRALLDEA